MKIPMEIWDAHPAVQAVLGSLVALLWFWGGMDELRKTRKQSAIGWLLISGTILMIVIVGHAADRHWGALVGVVALALEVRVITNR
jgi:hypothetical protein